MGYKKILGCALFFKAPYFAIIKTMKSAPDISEIKSWLISENPLKLFRNGNFSVEDIDPKPWSGHFNYLVKAGTRKFVLRFKGPEWGEPTRGILDEYRILKYSGKYEVAPKVYYLNENFFGESMILEEYLSGKLLTEFSKKEREKLFPAVARFIAELNKIPVKKSVLPFREPMTSYRENLRTWRRRLKIILENSRTQFWGKRIEKLMPEAEKMLAGFEKRLRKVLRQNGPAFIFESAHIGHCMKVKDGFRFLNWEQVSYGDPSYTLAVFLASISRQPDFEKIKKKMIEEYLKINPVPEFEELVDQRLKEREVSNLLWVLWAYVERGDNRPVDEAIGIKERFDRVKNIV